MLNKNKLTCLPYGKNERKNGFTVIELLVVFSLTAFITTLGVVSFVAYSRTQALTQTINKAKLTVQEAKFNALSGVKPSSTPEGVSINCTTGSLTGYRVDVDEINNSLKLYLLCSNAAATLMKTYTLSDSLSFFDDALTTCTQINFDALSSQATGSPLPCDVVVTGYNMSKTMTVDLGGNITIQ